MPKKIPLKDHDDPFVAVRQALQANHTRYAPDVFDLQKTRNQVKRCVEKIFSQHKRLNFLLDNYGDVISKRWQHKTSVARERVITAAWPVPLPQSYRPDIHTLLRYSLHKLPGPVQDYFFFPHLNIDDLSKPRPLMIMMHSRARNSPSAFAIFDNESMWLGHASGTIIPGTLPDQTMFLKGETTVETYGRMRRWGNDNRYKECQEEGIGLSPAKGLQVLFIQSQLFTFLVECAELILTDIKHHEPNNVIEAEKAASIAKLAIQRPSSLLEALLDEPYRAPPPIDFGHLEALLNAKRMEAIDHLWFLRQDPSYFRDAIEELSQHQYERLLDTKQQSNPRLGTPAFWSQIICKLMNGAICDPYHWYVAGKRLSVVKRLYEKHKKDMGPGQRLHPHFEKAVAKLQFHFGRLMGVTTLWIRQGLEGSPALRQFYRRNAKNDSEEIAMKSVKIKKDKNNTLLWMLERMKYSKRIQFWGLDNLLSYVHRLMLSDPKERQQVSGWLSKHLSDMALMDRVERLDTLFRFGREKKTLSLTALQMDHMQEMGQFHQTLKAMALGWEFLGLDDPLARLEYPCGGPKTEATTEKMIEAECVLDDLWDALSKGLGEQTGKSGEPLLARLVKKRPLERTPLWAIGNAEGTVESLDAYQKASDTLAELELKLKRVSFAMADMCMRPPNVPLHNSFESSDQAVPSQVPWLAEPSSRASSSPPSSADEYSIPDVSAPEPTDYTYALPVGKRAYRVFSILFPLPKYGGPQEEGIEPDTPASLAWTDFLNAMKNVDMMTEKLCGSGWIFMRKEDKEMGKAEAILFHEPPEGKVSAREAERWGRRLNWAFGWKRGTFVRASVDAGVLLQVPGNLPSGA
ncbi:MAG: hypothetical protein Q9202_007376 [Teloschistes flavicans]